MTVTDFSNLQPRGVYIERYTVRGLRWAFAIDSKHARILERPILAPEDRQTVIDDLWEQLDELDPAEVQRSTTMMTAQRLSSVRGRQRAGASSAARRARRAHPGMKERGVYRLGGGSSNYLLAIDSAGNRIADLHDVGPGAEYHQALSALWSKLDGVDPPRPRLRIV